MVSCFTIGIKMNTIKSNIKTLVSKISQYLKDDHGLLHDFCNDVITINMTMPHADRIISIVKLYEKRGRIIFDINIIEELNWDVYKDHENLIFSLLQAYFKSTDYVIKFSRNSYDDVCFGIERTITSVNEDNERFHGFAADEFLDFIHQVNTVITKITDLCDSFPIINK
jgi:hypothetical protein